VELQGSITINGRRYEKGDTVPWYAIYPFFMVHMGAFGVSGFFMAYSAKGAPLPFLYLHGGFACLVYLVFYMTLFGVDRVRWMFINAALGLFGIYAQIDWILALFDRQAGDRGLEIEVGPAAFEEVDEVFTERRIGHRKAWGKGDWMIASSRPCPKTTPHPLLLPRDPLRGGGEGT